jgi:membrane associated rhomboid family serine protease
MNIPTGDLILALGLAALIGAAGGWVYAGIMGPKRRRNTRRVERSSS